MKRMLQVLAVAALLFGTQSAWSIVKQGHDWLPKADSVFPADAEANFNLPALATYSDRYPAAQPDQAGDAFPVNLAGVRIDD